MFILFFFLDLGKPTLISQPRRARAKKPKAK